MNKLITYIRNSFNEVVHNVTWPKSNALRESTLLVVIGSLIFGLLIFAMDYGLKELSSLLY